MITGKTRVNNPDDVNITIELTMPLKEWREIRSQLVQTWPSWCLSSVIRSALYDVERIHCREQEYKSP